MLNLRLPVMHSRQRELRRQRRLQVVVVAGAEYAVFDWTVVAEVLLANHALPRQPIAKHTVEVELADAPPSTGGPRTGLRRSRAECRDDNGRQCGRTNQAHEIPARCAHMDGAQPSLSRRP